MKDNQKVGKILTNKFIMRNYVGDGTGKHNGKEVKFEMSTSMNFAPIIKYNNKYFALGWDDILQLAEQAGLFD